jgi:hypothetical protein
LRTCTTARARERCSGRVGVIRLTRAETRGTRPSRHRHRLPSGRHREAGGGDRGTRPQDPVVVARLDRSSVAGVGAAASLGAPRDAHPGALPVATQVGACGAILPLALCAALLRRENAASGRARNTGSGAGPVRASVGATQGLDPLTSGRAQEDAAITALGGIGRTRSPVALRVLRRPVQDGSFAVIR